MTPPLSGQLPPTTRAIQVSPAPPATARRQILAAREEFVGPDRTGPTGLHLPKTIRSFSSWPWARRRVEEMKNRPST